MTAGWQEMIRFIRCMSQTRLSGAEKDYALGFVTRDVPWDHLVALAEIKGVSGLLSCNLDKLGVLENLSDTAVTSLQSAYARTRDNSLAALEEAGRLSSCIARAGIPVMAIQGLSLMTTVYNDPGLRALGDIDLMVGPRHRAGLREILLKEGYKIANPVYPDLLYKAGHLIDIHTHLLNLERIRSRCHIFPEDLFFMWKRSAPLFDGYDGLLIPEPFDNFVALAAHALKHGYSRLIWLTDLHELLLRLADSGTGWETIIERSRSWRQERVVLYALILLKGVFGFKTPLRVMHELGIHRLNTVEKHLLRLRIRGLSSDLICNLLWLMNIKGMGNRLEFLWETLFPREEVIAQVISGSLRVNQWPVFAQRLAKAMTVMGGELYRAMAFSIRSSRR